MRHRIETLARDHPRRLAAVPAAFALCLASSTVSAAPPVPLRQYPEELPVWKIPNIPMSGEAYYAPDSLHVIAQVQDPQAVRPSDPRARYGSFTYTFTDQGTDIKRINDRGMDACSFFFPDMQRIVWTSTRDNTHLAPGSWDDELQYPKGAEIYVSDLDGGNVQRLTFNEYYDAEVTVSPDRQWILFGRQIDGRMDLWRMRPDGSEQQQITRTDDWQEGGAVYLPDSETILYRAWKRSDYGRSPLPMTLFTIRHDGTGLRQLTFDDEMNWAPFPAPDGRHYVFVRNVGPEKRNREIFLGNLEGGEPIRLTYNEGFDGFPSLSPDGTKMLFTRKHPAELGVFTYVMDVSSLNLGPRKPASARSAKQ
jgi:Tol biopolymer transport system component